MKITKQDGSDERLILTGMIVNPTICGKLTSKWKGEGLFRSRWSNLIGKWCCKHYERYGKAPGRKIENLFNHWLQKTKDESTGNIIEHFLSELSNEWQETKRDLNSDYVLDVAGKHFALVQAERLKEDLDDAIADGDADGAIEQITNFNRISIGQGEWFDPFKDKVVIRAAFDLVSDPLIVYPGALGKFFGDRLERDGLICIEGPEKRGKTFWLMDFVVRGVEQRRRVAYFQVGDMSRDQIMRRLMVRVANIPLKPCTIKIPKSIGFKTKVSESGEKWKEPFVLSRRKVFEKGLDYRTAIRACEEFQRRRIKSLETYLRLSVYPNDTLSVPDIKSLLTEWSREQWIADVVVIDYSDILRMDYHGLEGRERINQTWKDLRKLSQVFHCLVITASQSDAKGGEVRTLGRSHFSEDKRKRSHVTGTIGLNQTDREKEIGVMRLNWIVLREGRYLSSRCVFVAGCPEIGNLAMRSSF